MCARYILRLDVSPIFVALSPTYFHLLFKKIWGSVPQSDSMEVVRYVSVPFLVWSEGKKVVLTK